VKWWAQCSTALLPNKWSGCLGFWQMITAWLFQTLGMNARCRRMCDPKDSRSIFAISNCMSDSIGWVLEGGSPLISIVVGCDASIVVASGVASAQASSAAVLSSRSFLPASLLASGTWDTKEADWLRDWLRKCLLIRTLLAHFWYVMAPTASGIAGMTKGMLATKA